MTEKSLKQMAEKGKLKTLTDTDKLTLGKQYKGVELKDVPAHHLLWWYEQTDVKEKAELALYIQANLEQLILDRENNKKNNTR